MRHQTEAYAQGAESFEPSSSKEKVAAVQAELARRNLLPRLTTLREKVYQEGHARKQIPIRGTTVYTAELDRIDDLIVRVKKLQKGYAPPGISFDSLMQGIAKIDELATFHGKEEEKTASQEPLIEFPLGHEVWKQFGTLEEGVEYPVGHPVWEAYGQAPKESLEYPVGHPAWEAYGVSSHWPYDSVLEAEEVPKDLIAFLKEEADKHGYDENKELSDLSSSSEVVKNYLDAVTYKYIEVALQPSPERDALEEKLRNAFVEYKEALRREGIDVSNKEALVNDFIEEIEETTNAHPSAVGLVRTVLRNALVAVALLGLAAVTGNEAGKGSFTASAEAAQPHRAVAPIPQDDAVIESAPEEPVQISGPDTLESLPPEINLEDIPPGFEPPNAGSIQ